MNYVRPRPGSELETTDHGNVAAEHRRISRTDEELRPLQGGPPADGALRLGAADDSTMSASNGGSAKARVWGGTQRRTRDSSTGQRLHADGGGPTEGAGRLRPPPERSARPASGAALHSAPALSPRNAPATTDP
ncbi:hypothetical protein AAG570_003523 [Ranatra chinensis]|uniref:Uncharacterized protein n=1 Tax=Ranatra chinensis TaxID=642074 RepID=A0ABD0Y497_9HEMI